MKTKTTFSTYFFDSVAAQIINRHTQEGLTNKEIVCGLIFNIYWETDSTMYHNSVQIYCNMMLTASYAGVTGFTFTIEANAFVIFS